MKVKASIWLAACMVATLVGAQGPLAAATKAANSYKIELAVNRDQQQIDAPKFTVAFGKPAQITLEKFDTKERNYRFQVTAAPAGLTDKGAKKVAVDLVILEQIAGAWVILGEPTLTLQDGIPATLDVDGGAGAFGLSIKAESGFNAKAENFQSPTCPALTAQILPIPASKGSSPTLRANCCSVGCEDGSGRTMKCCGAIECCACGVCCSPPE